MHIGNAFAALLLASTALPAQGSAPQADIEQRSGKTITVGGLQFRDLNRNGTLEPYEDWRLPDAARAHDLVSRMTLEEKAGAMVHGTLAAVDHPLGLSTKGYDLAAMEPEITQRHITSMITRLAVAPAKMAEENNRIQEIATRGRLGIPMTISTDPRHHFQVVSGATTAGMGYSQWPGRSALARWVISS